MQDNQAVQGTGQQRTASCVEAGEIAERRWPGKFQTFVMQDRVAFVTGRQIQLQQYAEIQEDGESVLITAMEDKGIVYILMTN